MGELTPMMRQYLEIKEQNKDSILFFRLGDFYEMFNDDARLVSDELDLTLTTRDRGKPPEEQTPMCGVPYHSSEAYIARLIAKGYKVAICEQTEDPAAAKGIVKREIVRVVTPGTVVDEASLDERRSNFISGVYVSAGAAGVCFCDVSTGKMFVTCAHGAECIAHIENEFGRFSPAEVVANDAAAENNALSRLWRERLFCHVERQDAGAFAKDASRTLAAQHFGEDALAAIESSAALCALGGLLSYLHRTQKCALSHINELEYYDHARFMELDLTARRNLELTETMRGKEKRGSLLWVLDKTKTAMGARLLRAWLERPLLDIAEISRRSGAVGALVENTIAREELSLALSGIGDMERLLGRIVYGTAGARDVAALGESMRCIGQVRALLEPFEGGLLAKLRAALDPLDDLAERIGATIDDKPPFSVREGGFIRKGFHTEVDRLRSIRDGGKDMLAAIEARVKEQYGIKNLKVAYNKVFGYYIEVARSQIDLVPAEWVRKQTTVNSERYINQELKDLEHEILTAGERLAALEYEIFRSLCDTICENAQRVQRTAAALAEVDVLCALATVAVKYNYCCPTVDDSGIIDIRDGRHCVVERVLKDSLFVPNDTLMETSGDRVAIITGPNMAGKSTYMRQVALIVLLAQIGSFVPARSARIGIVDRIFTRIGASDDLAAGQSTFMVEMNEVAELLKSATSKSLLLLDEIGRGTSTFDGMSIARAVLEHCADGKKLGAKTLFATHYHELTALESALSGVRNYNIAIKSRGDDIVFLRKIVPGGADRSYGIEVAKLAGLPEGVIRRARAILAELEGGGAPARSAVPEAAAQSGQMSFGSLAESEVMDALRRVQPETLTPIEAIGMLYELHKKLSS
ncbi:MAG: DNA mismatch repair protein MutS [Oscillospiraceae bacterium]|nr:DNA mismatch repair protein MutS [Oscillospiraceae bacterium]